MREGAPEKGVGDLLLENAEDIEPVAPAVVLFGKLAGLVTAEGAMYWASSVGRIEAHFGTVDERPITEQEQVWLRRMSNGDRTLDIATDDGYSERSLYRALSELWDRLGVDNRIEAIALATRNGWI